MGGGLCDFMQSAIFFEKSYPALLCVTKFLLLLSLLNLKI